MLIFQIYNVISIFSFESKFLKSHFFFDQSLIRFFIFEIFIKKYIAILIIIIKDFDNII